MNRGLALVGHTDTVPYDPDWREALLLTRDGDRFVSLEERTARDSPGYLALALTALVVDLVSALVVALALALVRPGRRP